MYFTIFENLYKVHRLVFGQENEVLLVEKIRQSDRYINEFALVAKMR